jgi:cell wall-associated protease
MNCKWLLPAVFFLATTSYAQDQAPDNWFNLDAKKDGVPGLSTEKTYQELLKGKKARTIVVAVLDSGVDYEHEDLKDVMWVNDDEIAGNGIDDDNNGYVDDIHGWNFLGNSKGENVHHDNLEVTRQYVLLHKRFKDVSDAAGLPKKDRADYDKYKLFGKVIEDKIEEMTPNVGLYGSTLEAFVKLQEAIGKPAADITLTDLENFRTSDPFLPRVAAVGIDLLKQGETFAGFLDQVKEAYDYFHDQVNYNYNTEFDPRALVGDDYNNVNERYYGNNDVKGPFSYHGTHVSGIIAAKRGNNLGIEGVADHVRIMSVRTVPNGDERDKDVANAIRYAVDNGAHVINMSFGKGDSPYKDAVDEAVKYAMKNDVLLIHGAGNDGEEIKYDNNFPNDKFMKKGLFKPKYAKNWMEVGAHGWQTDENMTADFSNYSATLVDVFAPGVDIYSTEPDNSYKVQQGTSMAAPMVAGLAALLRSYFPDLSATQVKEIIMSSSVRQTQKVKRPGEDALASFSDLCVTGGIVNAYNAVKMASTTKGKRKKPAGIDNTGAGNMDNKAAKQAIIKP